MVWCTWPFTEHNESVCHSTFIFSYRYVRTYSKGRQGEVSVPFAICKKKSFGFWIYGNIGLMHKAYKFVAFLLN